MNKGSIKSFIKLFIVAAVLATAMFVALFLSGCASQAEFVSMNVSKEADNFNVVRRITVINSRSDKVVLTMIGKMSIEDVDHGIAVLVEIDRQKSIYQKHYIYLNDWTMYTVEDVNGIDVSAYAYEIEFMPEQVVPVRITTNEIEQRIDDKQKEKEENG